MRVRSIALILAFAAAPIAAQVSMSKSYKFLEAVRKASNEEVVSILDEPGQTIINTRDATTGEGALHIVVKRGDALYLRYLLSKGADRNIRDARGTTPLMLAVEYSKGDLVDILTRNGANPNLGNSAGETPLIRAVQKRDLALVRALLAAKANPDQTDRVAGQSARDYAHADPRAGAIAKLIDEVPKGATRAVAGPKL